MRTVRKVFCKRKTFGLQKRLLFQRIQSHIFHILRKVFYKRAAATIFRHSQTNEQLPFLNSICYCELAVQQSFSETSQSCVSTTVTLSHRFKSSPAIPGKVAIPGTAGYMMNAGHFSENFVSSGDLNRSPESRGSQTSGILLVLFVQAKRINPYSLAGSFEVLRTSIQPTKRQHRTNKLKSFAAPRPLKLSFGKFSEVFQTSMQLTAAAVSCPQINLKKSLIRAANSRISRKTCPR